MGQIAHLRKQFKSINTFDYFITLIKVDLHSVLNGLNHEDSAIKW